MVIAMYEMDFVSYKWNKLYLKSTNEFTELYVFIK